MYIYLYTHTWLLKCIYIWINTYMSPCEPHPPIIHLIRQVFNRAIDLFMYFFIFLIFLYKYMCRSVCIYTSIYVYVYLCVVICIYITSASLTRMSCSNSGTFAASRIWFEVAIFLAVIHTQSHTHTHAYTHICTCIHVLCMHVHIYIYICICLYAYMFTCIYI